jgi:hypothetical protein
MATFQQNLGGVEAARRKLNEARERLYTERLKVQSAENPTSLAEVRQSLASAMANVENARHELDRRIAILLDFPDHRDAARELEAEIPVLFFPVRLETRFVTVNRRPELLVRIYPDDIHVHSFEERLTAAEVDAGEGYWRGLAAVNRAAGDDADGAKAKVWEKLVAPTGVQRALWIVKQTRPENWQPDFAGADDALRFPARDRIKTHDWTRAPQTQLLPDRFVAQIYQGGKLVHSEIGKPVPDTVFMGPDPFLAEGAFKETGKSIEFDESFAWTADFDEAVAKGLGIRIPLTSRGLRGGTIDRLVVMGLLASADPEAGARMLEEHIHAQRHSKKGFSFLPQGTPTNNTAKSDSAYTKNFDILPLGYYDGREPTSLEQLADSDGLAFARAMGIDPAVLADARHAEKTEVAEAAAMNAALYPATIGNFLEVLSEPAVSRTAQPQIREFFTDFVSATGPLSSIRVGDQPYGVLVSSDLTRWREPSSDPVMNGLTRVLLHLHGRWTALRKDKVAHVAQPGDAAKIMLEIMGLSAGSVSFRQRLAHLSDFALSARNVNASAADMAAKQDRVVALMREAGYTSTSFPLVTGLSFYRDRSRIPYNYLVDRKRPATDRFLDPLGSQGINYIQWLANVRQLEELEGHRLPGAKPPRSVLYFLLRHSLLLSLQTAAIRTYQSQGYEFKRGANEKSLYNFDTEVRDLTSWEILHGTPKRVDPTKLNISDKMGNHLLTLPRNRQAVADLSRFRRACERLATLSTQRLHQTLSDHIDLCAYRLDAWHTGLFYRRLSTQRRERQRGVYLGAYGWVENIAPERKRRIAAPEALAPDGGGDVFEERGNAGFIHTPSLNHATAAGVLHAGYRNQADADRPDVFAVNLSSERVRRGLQIYQGVQNGQPMEALLGYQFERALHDETTRNPANNLNQFILPLREKFPIESATIPQAGTEAQETVSPYPVVNGLKLIGASGSDFADLGLNPGHLATILKEKDRLADSLDAVGDLLTAEGAYQMVQGKTDRTVGVLNSFANATLPPDLEVNRTPRSTRLTVNNRICLGFGDTPAPAANAGWARKASPRSSTEPGINGWLASQIGNPRKIVCTVTTVAEDGAVANSKKVRLSDLKLQPIDLVYAVSIDVQSGAKDLEQRIFRAYRKQVELRPMDRVAIRFDRKRLTRTERSFAQVLPLIRYLRLLITTGRVASANDFLPRSKTEDEAPDLRHGWDTAEFEQRVNDLQNGLLELIHTLGSTAPNRRLPKTVANPATLRQLFELYADEGGNVERLAAMRLTPTAVTRLLNFVESVSLYGIKSDYPERVDIDDRSTTTELLKVAATAWKTLDERMALAEEKLDAAAAADSEQGTVRRLTEAVKAILGDDFVTLPAFHFRNPDDLAATLAEGGAQLLAHYDETYDTTPSLAIETWLQSLTPVRPAVQRLEQIRLIAEFQRGERFDFVAAQVPYREGDSWLALDFPAIDKTTGEPFGVKHDTISLCLSGFDPAGTRRRQRVLIVDEWSEAVPNDREVTGIAFNYNQPNACAPNALLLAVEPTGDERWDWDVLSGVLSDTLVRAKNRAVEPAHLLEDPALDVLSPMTIASFDLHNANISLDYLATDDDLVGRLRNSFELYRGLD